jgi:hypothetical protein
MATNANGLHGMIPGKPLGVPDLNDDSWGGTRTRDPGILRGAPARGTRGSQRVPSGTERHRTSQNGREFGAVRVQAAFEAATALGREAQECVRLDSIPRYRV